MSKLPENWKPCKVNYPANPTQYTINTWAYSCNKDWREGESTARQYSWLNLYKTPGLWSLYVSQKILLLNWQSFIEANDFDFPTLHP
jgi:hypothetical protein